MRATDQLDALLGLGPLYQPIELPEFAGREVAQPCRERLAMIRLALGERPPGLVVDLGCHTGWFTRAFSHAGWEALGVDRSAVWLQAAQLLNELVPLTKKPRYLLSDLAAFRVPTCDVALCLSVIMYTFQPGGGGWPWLDEVSWAAPVAFMDFGGMYAEHVPFTVDEAVEAVTGKTRWRRGELLGRTALEARPLFMFTR